MPAPTVIRFYFTFVQCVRLRLRELYIISIASANGTHTKPLPGFLYIHAGFWNVFNRDSCFLYMLFHFSYLFACLNSLGTAEIKLFLDTRKPQGSSETNNYVNLSSLRTRISWKKCAEVESVT